MQTRDTNFWAKIHNVPKTTQYTEPKHKPLALSLKGRPTPIFYTL